LEFYRAVRWMDSLGIEALIPRVPSVQYYWPDHPVQALAASYTVYEYSGAARTISTQEQLALAAGSFDFVHDLPKVYYGVVRRDVIERILRQNGSVFQGVTPDHYSMYRISSVVKNATIVDYPVFLPGCSGKSNAANASSRRTDWGRHLSEYREDALEWPSILPHKATRSLMTYLAEPLVRALRDSDRPDLLKDIDLSYIYFVAIRNDPASFRANLPRYLAACRTLERSPRAEVRSLASGIARHLTGAVRRRLLRQRPSAHVRDGVGCSYVRDIRDIGEAMDSMDRLLAARGTTPPWAARPEPAPA
jgi:hypothetical protein